jgi:hypothetical protein
MLTNIFESRNKTFLNLVKLGDYLGRSLRESVELFSVDGDAVTYLTESKYVIRGSYKSSPLSLTEIEIEDSSIFENKDVYNKLVDNKISNFLIFGNIFKKIIISANCVISNVFKFEFEFEFE